MITPDHLSLIREDGLINMAELARRIGIDPTAFRERIRRGSRYLSAEESAIIERELREAMERYGVAGENR